MGDILTESLFRKNPRQFSKISEQAKAFSANNCGGMIAIRDSIFLIAVNYVRKRELSLEILRYPFHDDELWAFTFIKKGTIFLCVNSELAMCKQIFAAAHELYHIHCYADEIDPEVIARGSLLYSKTADDLDASQEDLEANAFAGLILMPESSIAEQMKLYGIEAEKVSPDDVLTLMDLYALPYKAVVLRLVENGNISDAKARELLKTDSSYIQERSELTGKAWQWQISNPGMVSLGSFLENLDYNTENELLTKSREEMDRQRLERLKQYFKGRNQLLSMGKTCK